MNEIISCSLCARALVRLQYFTSACRHVVSRHDTACRAQLSSSRRCRRWCRRRRRDGLVPCAREKATDTTVSVRCSPLKYTHTLLTSAQPPVALSSSSRGPRARAIHAHDDDNDDVFVYKYTLATIQFVWLCACFPEIVYSICLIYLHVHTCNVCFICQQIHVYKETQVFVLRSPLTAPLSVRYSWLAMLTTLMRTWVTRSARCLALHMVFVCVCVCKMCTNSARTRKPCQQCAGHREHAARQAAVRFGGRCLLRRKTLRANMCVLGRTTRRRIRRRVCECAVYLRATTALTYGVSWHVNLWRAVRKRVCLFRMCVLTMRDDQRQQRRRPHSRTHDTRTPRRVRTCTLFSRRPCCACWYIGTCVR